MLTIPPNANSDSIDKSLVITQEQQLQYAIQVASGLVRSKQNWWGQNKILCLLITAT